MERKIKVTYEQPPIPIRDFDYIATLDGYEPGDCMGNGSTKQAAIDDLNEQLDDAEDQARG